MIDFCTEPEFNGFIAGTRVGRNNHNGPIVHAVIDNGTKARCGVKATTGGFTRRTVTGFVKSDRELTCKRCERRLPGRKVPAHGGGRPKGVIYTKNLNVPIKPEMADRIHQALQLEGGGSRAEWVRDAIKTKLELEE